MQKSYFKNETKHWDKKYVDYFSNEGLDKYISYNEKQYELSAFFSVVENESPYPAELDDLVNLHQLIRKRKVFNVLEFGLGFSTIVIADALKKNSIDYQDYDQKDFIRRNKPFLVESVDNNKKWISKFKSNELGSLNNYIKTYFSESEIQLYKGQVSCGFMNLPNNTVPDFIYLDGPGNENIKGSIIGFDFKKNPDMTIVANDLLKIESLLLPGCYILVDGRSNNARFLFNNFKRNWEYYHDENNDTHHFELIEKPLGGYNKKMLQYCLGDYFEKNY